MFATTSFRALAPKKMTTDMNQKRPSRGARAFPVGKRGAVTITMGTNEFPADDAVRRARLIAEQEAYIALAKQVQAPAASAPAASAPAPAAVESDAARKVRLIAEQEAYRASLGELPARAASAPETDAERKARLVAEQAAYRAGVLAAQGGPSGGTRKFIVGGNWKCNGTLSSITVLINDLNAGQVTADVEVVCAPPFVYIPYAQAGLRAPFEVAAQNCLIGPGGAFTGEVSADMLLDQGIGWVILGHSERRALLGETNEDVGKKCAYALSKGLKVIACCGETLEERQGGQMMTVIKGQLQAIVDEISPHDWSNVVIAYEPVWAIGTGAVATPEQAQEVHASIRSWLAETVSPAVASSTRIQYGGSVNGGNCETLALKEDIDGFLVGGASLKGPEFVQICNSASVTA